MTILQAVVLVLIAGFAGTLITIATGYDVFNWRWWLVNLPLWVVLILLCLYWHHGLPYGLRSYFLLHLMPHAWSLASPASWH
jgi:hypothetical protein